LLIKLTVDNHVSSYKQLFIISEQLYKSKKI